MNSARNTFFFGAVLVLAACGDGGSRRDTVAPVITLNGDNPQVIEAGTLYIELGASAIDNVDGDLTNAVSVDASAIDITVPGDYTVVYEVSDAAGNSSTISRVVRVEDTTPPQITLYGDQLQSIVVGDLYVELGATSSDNIDGDLSDEIVINTSTVNLSVSGTYEVRYEVSDSSGNLATATRTVRVLIDGQWEVIDFPWGLHLDSTSRAFTLEDGRVLGIGYTIWVFDPDTQAVETLFTNDYRGFTATALLDGRILVAGAQDRSVSYCPDLGSDRAFIFDPSDFSMSSVGSMLEARSGHSATLLENGQVLIAGGCNGISGINRYVDTAEIFDPATNTFFTAGSLTSARFGHTATRLVDGTVLIAGGARDSDSVLSAELYMPMENTFREAATMPGDGRWLHTANLLASGKVLIAGGIPGWRAYYDPWDFQEVLLYDPADDSFAAVDGPDIMASSHLAVSLPSTVDCPGTVLAAAGANGWKSFTDETMIFDPVIEQFYPTARIPTGRVYGAATVLKDGRILFVGGGCYHHSADSIEIFDPLGVCN
jgi:hypothetical protein